MRPLFSAGTARAGEKPPGAAVRLRRFRKKGSQVSVSEIEAIRALLSAKPRPVGWEERRRRIDEVCSVWPVADE
jgi:hypothetical protein